jgi:hypothetical protein
MGIFDEEDKKKTTGARGTQGATTEHTEDTEKRLNDLQMKTNEEIQVVQLEVEAVIGGCLQRVTLTGVSPEKTLEFLKGLDAGVKVRDDFPKMGKGFGARETKSAVAMVMTAKKKGDYKSLDITCEGADGDVTVSVGKNGMDEIVQKLGALKCLHESAALDKVAAALTGVDGQATCILKEGERFAVTYATGGNGAHYLEGVAEK